jgi:murein DD-endopeptidase MepM/ murein hydrolase activator NlpD
LFLQLALFGLMFSGFWQNSPMAVLRQAAMAAQDLSVSGVANAATLALATSLKAAQAAPQIVKTLAVAHGDTLFKLLTTAGAKDADSRAAVDALKPLYDPRKLKLGQELTVTLEREPSQEAYRLTAINFSESVEHKIALTRQPDGFAAEKVSLPLTPSNIRAAGVIEDSLYVAAVSSGVPLSVLSDLVRIFSFDVDFQRDIQPGDRFEVFYDQFTDDQGRFVKGGDVQSAALILSGKENRVWRYQPKPSEPAEYFDARGQTARKALLKTPVDGARLTSRFGSRRHPILGFTKMHNGADFGAATGTPIQAAGGGVVQTAGWNGGYGKYVRIRHNGTYSTAYAHMSRIAVRQGQRVNQGEIIGYVGTTGRSTGPHLHYEVLVNNRAVNPMGVRLPSGRKLEGAELADFHASMETIQAAFDATPAPSLIASR